MRLETGYDVFISYAREDGAWVKRELFEPLMRCRTPNGRKPRVFLDADKEGVPPGVPFMEFLAEAVAASRTVVSVYSTTYFAKPMCRWELAKVVELDPTGDKKKLTPILIDAEVEKSLPFHVSGINYVDIRQDGWFERLVASLGVTQPEAPAQLEFLESLQEVTVQHTLPAVRVGLTREGARVADQTVVTLTSEGGALQGTASVPARDGVAVFEDLSIGTVLESTRLVASAEGCLPAFSQPFRVREAPKTRTGATAPMLPGSGAVVFFADERSVARISTDRVAVFDVAGDERTVLPLDSRLRWIRRGGALLALGFWSGRVALVDSSGERIQWDFAAAGAYAIPGDLAVAADRAWVGFWDGRVFELAFGEPATPLFEHGAGVAAIAVDGKHVCVADLDGSLAIHREGRLVREHRLEPVIRGMKTVPGAVVAVGERNLYRIALPDGEPLSVELPLDGATAALTEPDLPVVMDGEGKAVVFDRELSIRGGFHAGPGSVPVSADRESRWCVEERPDGSRSLVDLTDGTHAGRATSGRVILTQTDSSLAVAPSGSLFAVGTDEGARLVPSTVLEQMIAELAGGC